MEASEFNSLAASQKVISVRGDSREIEVVFENGIIVTIETGIEWEAPVLYYETNVERQSQQQKWEHQRQQSQLIADEKQRILIEIKSKYTPEQWAEIQKAFKG